MTHCETGIHNLRGVARGSCVELGKTAAVAAPKGILRQFRAALLAGTALSVGMLAFGQQASAVSECGAIPPGPNSTVNCTGLVINNGIEYEPNAGNEIFTLNIGDGTIAGATAVTAPTILGFGQHGVAVGDLFLGQLVGGADATSVININEFSQVMGTSTGAFLWTDGAGNDATVNNYGTVLSTGAGFLSLGHGVVVVAGNPLSNPTGSGNATGNNYGTINALNSGLAVWSEEGTATALNEGTINTQNGSGIAIIDPILGLLPTGGTGTATNRGTINAGGFGIQIFSLGGATATNEVTGTITSGSDGINIASGGNAIVQNGGLIDSINGNGIQALAAGAVTIDGFDPGTGKVYGTVNAINGAGILGASTGDLVVDGDGSTVTITSGTVVAGRSGVVGLSDGGEVIVTTGGETTFGGLFGVAAITSGGDSDSIVNVNHKITAVPGAVFGAFAFADGAGNATVNVNADIDPPLIGAAAATSGAGTALVNVADGVSVQADLIGALGLSLGDGEVNIQVGNGSSVTSVTGGFGIGIAALDVGDGGILVDIGQGSVVRGDTFGFATLGIDSGDTSISVGSGSVVASDTGGLGIGIGAASLESGNIDISLAAGTQTDSTRVLGDTIGIGALALGSGNITINVESNARVTSESGGLGVGIAAAAFGSGNVDVNIAQNSVVLADTTAIAAIATGFGGGSNTVTIENAGLIQGNGGTFIPVIFAASDAGIDITNSGLIRGSLGDTNPDGSLVDGDARLESIMLGISGGPINITNTRGRMIGNVALLSDAGNTVSLDAQSRWDTGGFNIIGLGGDDTIQNAGLITTGQRFTVFFFGRGDDLLVNSGRIVARNATAFIGLNNFDNSGVLDMLDGDIGEFVFTTGNFNGLGGSRLRIDALLNGPAGPGEAADLLVVRGNVTGRTGLVVNDLLAGKPGTFNPDGVVFAVVGGDTQQGNFFLANGPIDKGLFSYDTFLRPDVKDGKDWWVLASRPDQTFFELPSIISAAQSLWHSSTGVWLDRTADLRAPQEVCMPGGLKDELVCAPGVRPGVWAKAFGNWSERSQDHRFSLHNRHFRHDVEYDQDSFGIIGGVDFTPGFLPAYGPGGWLLGVMAGYINSNQDFDRSTTDVDFEGALVGGYATFLSGGFFIDAQVAANIGDVEYSNTAQTLAAKDNSDLTSIGGVIDTGYRFAVSPAGAFIEPGASLAYVNSDVDDLRIYGTKIRFEDGDSLRGRLGVRLGLSSLYGGYKVEPFIGASAWYEFLGENDVAMTSGGVIFTAEDDVSGWIGEVTGGVNVLEISTAGVSGFAKGNYQFGEDDYQSFTGQIGVRFQW